MEDIEPNSLKGKVNISHQIWSATSDANIRKGAMVKVIDWDGVHVIVEEEEELMTPPRRGEAKV